MGQNIHRKLDIATLHLHKISYIMQMVHRNAITIMRFNSNFTTIHCSDVEVDGSHRSQLKCLSIWLKMARQFSYQPPLMLTF